MMRIVPVAEPSSHFVVIDVTGALVYGPAPYEACQAFLAGYLFRFAQAQSE